MGNDYSAKQKITSIDNLIPVFRERLAEGQSVRFQPQGYSMLPMIRQGIDSVVVAPLPQVLKKYDIALYRRDSDAYVLHRVVGVDGNTYTLLGDNQFAVEPGIRHDQMIGVVTSFCRGGREHSVDEIGYKTYCRLWYHSRRFRHLWRRVKRKLRMWLCR